MARGYNSLTAKPGSHVDFGFTEEQLMIQDVARRIAQEKIAPSAEHFDQTGEFPLDNIRLLGENGLMGIEVPAEYGGAGMDPVAYVLAMVEIAAGDAAHSTIMSVNNSLFCNGILNYGTEAAEAEVRARDRRGRRDRRLRADRAAVRLRRHRDALSRGEAGRRHASSSTARRAGSPPARSPSTSCCSR